MMRVTTIEDDSGVGDAGDRDVARSRGWFFYLKMFKREDAGEGDDDDVVLVMRRVH